MKQYCRYCAYCIYGDHVWCEQHEKTMSEETAKKVNTCKDFEFNPIDVFTHNKYKPRKKKTGNFKQERLL